MLDIKFIIANKDKVQEAADQKQIDLNIAELIEIFENRKKLKQEVEILNHKRKLLAQASRGSKPSSKQIHQGKEIKNKAAEIDKKLSSFDKKYNLLMSLVPQIPATGNPVGEDASKNIQIKTWGKITKFKFPIKSHLELGKSLDLIDFDKGVKVHGFRGYFLKNEAATMQMGLIMLAIKKMLNRGYTFMINPTLIREFALFGSGHFPFGKEEVFKIENVDKATNEKSNKEALYLAGTSEPSLLAYYSDETLNKKNLPIKTCGFSTCYRSEVGSYGKDTKGLYRMHEFMKVEQLIICENDYKVSMKYFQEMKEIAEEMLQDLKLPYQIVQTCTGDMGAGKYRMDDIEAWMPSRESYGETHSCSNLGDWQARRLNIKYTDQAGNKKLVHTLNNTVIASPRILIAILENYQQADGTIKVPKILQTYVGKKIIKAK